MVFPYHPWGACRPRLSPTRRSKGSTAGVSPLSQGFGVQAAPEASTHAPWRELSHVAQPDPGGEEPGDVVPF